MPGVCHHSGQDTKLQHKYIDFPFPLQVSEATTPGGVASRKGRENSSNFLERLATAWQIIMLATPISPYEVIAESIEMEEH